MKRKPIEFAASVGVTVALVAAVIAIANGTTTKTVTLPAQKAAPPTLAAACPPGRSFTGCSAKRILSLTPRTAFPAGCLIPDVSQWQGAVNWPAVTAWEKARGCRPAGIFKLGELSQDPQAARNAQQLHALHAWLAAYWFVRNTGCAAESSQIIANARQLGVKVVFLDLEVPEAHGYGLCLTPPLKRAGLIVGEYTSPGSNPGGVDESDPLWEATFGPSFTPIWHPVVAWQFTDAGSIPGIASAVDVSVNLGILNLGNPQPKPQPKTVCFGPGYNPRHHAAVCNTIRPLTSRRSRARDASLNVEHQAQNTLAANHCRKPYRRRVCVRNGRTYQTMRHRVLYFARLVQTALKQYG